MVGTKLLERMDRFILGQPAGRETETERRRREKDERKREYELQRQRDEEIERQRVTSPRGRPAQYRRPSASRDTYEYERQNTSQHDPRPPAKDYHQDGRPLHDFQRIRTEETTSSRYSFHEDHRTVPQEELDIRPVPVAPSRKPVAENLQHDEEQSRETQPARYKAWDPRGIPEKIAHRKQKSNTSAKLAVLGADDLDPDHTASSIDVASVQAVADGDETPSASQVDLNAEHDKSISSHDAVRDRGPPRRDSAPSQGFRDRALPPVSPTHGDYAAYRNRSIAEQFQLPVMKHEPLDFSVDTEGNASEMEGDALTSPSSIHQATGSREDTAFKASRDLYTLCTMLRNIEPEDKNLAKCKSAEKAATLVEGLYRKAVHGWTSQHNRAEHFAKIAGEVEQLRKDNQKFKARNDLLEERMEGHDDRHKLRDELLTQTRKNNVALETENEKLRTDHASALEAQRQWWDKKLSTDKSQLNEEISTLAKERNSLRQSNDGLRQTAIDNQLEVGRLTQEVARLNNNLKNTIARLEADDRRARQDREKLIGEKREEMAALEIAHSNDTKDMRAAVDRLEAEKEGLQADIDDKLDALRREHATVITDIRFEHGQALARKDDERKEAEEYLDDFYKGEMSKKDQLHQRLKDSNLKQLADQSKRYKDQINALHSQVDDLQAQIDKVEDRFKQQYMDKEQRLKLTYQRELNNVKQERENLMGALVERNAFKGVPDHVVESRFKKLAKAVDQFARTCTNWDRSREAEWPYPDNLIRSQDNPRQMKQYFVQNAVWTTLYDGIFDNPFQSFGYEGQSLYEDWIAAFGENPVSLVAPHWPEPSKKTEEWRYDSVQKCMEAVEKSTGDPLLKGAYIQNTQQIGDNIIRTLGRLVATTSSQQNAIKDMVRQAAKLWLDIGIQRCRILIIVPQGSRGTSRRHDGQRLREFVVQPEVQRFGNSQGENLDTQEVVICKMDVHRVGVR